MSSRVASPVQALDDAVLEGLVAGALWHAQNVGWQPCLIRHLKLRVVREGCGDTRCA